MDHDYAFVAEAIVRALGGIKTALSLADLPAWQQRQLVVDACIDAGLSPADLGFLL
jgi:hypothetical protein